MFATRLIQSLRFSVSNMSSEIGRGYVRGFPSIVTRTLTLRIAPSVLGIADSIIPTGHVARRFLEPDAASHL